MEEDNKRLIDEASESEAIKNTFLLGWEFIKLNQTFTFTVMGILIFLNLLGMIPVISLIASMLASVMGIALQIYAGRTLYISKDINDYVTYIKNSRIDDDALKKYISTAFGVYIGWVIFLVIFIFIAVFMAVSSGLINENMSQNDLLLALTPMAFPILLVLLILSYVQPLVHSNVVLANNFQEGFKAVFTIFSKDVWASAMQKEYFSYVAILVLLMMLMIIPFIIIGTTFGMGLAFNILFVIISYVMMIIISIGAMIARRIVEK